MNLKTDCKLPSKVDVYRRVARARRFIDQHYDSGLSLDEICKHARFSRFHFLRVFKEVFGKTPHQYLIHKRIEKAKSDLTRSTLTVTEVCFGVGFESLGSFSTLFRKMVGCSPTAYRAKFFQRKKDSLDSPEISLPACFLIMNVHPIQHT